MIRHLKFNINALLLPINRTFDDFMHDKKNAQQSAFNIYYAPTQQKYILFQSMCITTPDNLFILFQTKETYTILTKVFNNFKFRYFLCVQQKANAKA